MLLSCIPIDLRCFLFRPPLKCLVIIHIVYLTLVVRYSSLVKAGMRGRRGAGLITPWRSISGEFMVGHEEEDDWCQLILCLNELAVVKEVALRSARLAAQRRRSGNPFATYPTSRPPW
jgi:hypothetical protein